MKRLTAFAAVLAAGTTLSQGAALSLDGVDDWVEISNGTGVIPSGSSAFTIGAWVNPDVHSDNTMTFWGNQASNEANGFRLMGGGNVRHYFWGNDHDRNIGDISDNTTGPNGDGWHHLAVTFDGTNQTWYHNGANIGARVAAGVAMADANHRIGSRLGAEFFDGLIDDITIWGAALSDGDIAGGWNQPIDLSSPAVGAALIAYYDFENGFADVAALGGGQDGVSMGGALIDPTANSPIPEPAAAVLGMLGALLLLRRQRR
jgi:MYXO-CTERM domain-containing protein